MGFKLEIGRGQIRLGFTRSNNQLKQVEKRGYPYDLMGGGMFSSWGWGEPTSASERVNELRAMRIAAVYTCQKILAETLASMPPLVMQRQKTGQRKVAYEHPAQYLIHDAPNADMTAYDFWYTLMLHASGWGAGYAEITRDIYGEVIELDILAPWEVTPKTVEGDMYYIHRSSAPDGKQFESKTYSADELLIIKGFTLNGKVAVSPIRFNSETMGFAIKQEKYRGKAFGSKPPGYLQSDQNIKEDQIPKIKEHWTNQVTGDEVGGTPVLYNGLSYKNLSFSPADLQALDMSEATEEDIYGIFRIPPTFAQKYKNATYSNAEQQDLVFMKYTMLPWITNIEQECNAKLYSASNRTDKEPLFTKFDMSVFLRADYKTMTEGVRTLISCGVYSVNMALQKLDLDTIDEPWADQHFLQMNMIPLDKMNDFVEKLSTIPAHGQGGTGGTNEGRSAFDILIERALANSNGNGKH